MNSGMFAALGEPNRFRIVELLRTGPRPVHEIGDRLRLRQPLVSQHLKVLRRAGLVEVEAVAQKRLYGLRANSLKRLHDWLDRYRRISRAEEAVGESPELLRLVPATLAR